MAKNTLYIYGRINCKYLPQTLKIEYEYLSYVKLLDERYIEYAKTFIKRAINTYIYNSCGYESAMTPAVHNDTPV